MLARDGSRVAVQAQVGSDEKGGVMKYHSLSRRELQALCKEYHIPANKSNVAMAQALAALHNTPAPTPGTKLLTVGRPSTVSIVEGARLLKPSEKKQSPRISLVSRCDQEVVRSEAGAKKLPAQSCKKLIPAIAVLNGSASCRQTFEIAQTDSSSRQAAIRKMMPSRNAQVLKLRPKEVNGSERTLSREPCMELLPSISPIEKSKMGRTKPVVKRELGKELGAGAVKSDAIYTPSGKENFPRNVKTTEKFSLQNEENYLVQKCLQPEEMRRSFNNCVKAAAKETSAAAAPAAAALKPLSSNCNSYAVVAQHDEVSRIATRWENAAAAAAETVSVAAKTTQAKGTIRSFCLDEELSNRETSSGLKESDAGFVSALHLSPLNIQSVRSKNSSTLSTQRSVIDYILLPPWSPPKASVVAAEQSACHRRSKRLTTNRKTGGGVRNCRENGSAVAELPLKKNDYLMRSLCKLRTSIRDKVMRKVDKL